MARPETRFGKTVEYLNNRAETREENLEDIEFNSKKTIEKNDFFVAVLKKWNSISPKYPIVQSDIEGKNYDEDTYGGGFFVAFGEYGLVIDPGYRFLELFYENGFVLNDIDGIFISHCHDDHCIELEPIFSLLFKMKKYRERHSSTPKKIDLFINETTKQKYFEMLTNDNALIRELIITNTNETYEITNDDSDNKIEMSFFRTFHKESPWTKKCKNGRGLKIKFLNKTIVYSSDTEWYDDLELNNIENVNVMILNLGKIGTNILGETKNHLGMMGIKEIIDNIYKKISSKNELPQKIFVLLSEFGVELKKFRTRILNAFKRYCINEKYEYLTFIHGEPGLIIDLKNEIDISRISFSLYNPNFYCEKRYEIEKYLKSFLGLVPNDKYDFIILNGKEIKNLIVLDETSYCLPKSQHFFNSEEFRKITRITYTKKNRVNSLDLLKFQKENKHISSIRNLKSSDIEKFIEFIELNYNITEDKFITFFEYEKIRKI